MSKIVPINLGDLVLAGSLHKILNQVQDDKQKQSLFAVFLNPKSYIPAILRSSSTPNYVAQYNLCDILYIRITVEFSSAVLVVADYESSRGLVFYLKSVPKKRI